MTWLTLRQIIYRAGPWWKILKLYDTPVVDYGDWGRECGEGHNSKDETRRG